MSNGSFDDRGGCCLNVAGQVRALDKRCPLETVYGKMPTLPVLPPIIPGYSHGKRGKHVNMTEKMQI